MNRVSVRIRADHYRYFQRCSFNLLYPHVCSAVLQLKQIFVFFVGMNVNEGVKTERSDQQLPSASSQASYDSCSFHRSDTNDTKKVLATTENKQQVKKVGGETKIN